MRLLLLRFIYRSDGRKTAADAAEIAVGAVTAQRKKTGTVSGKMDNKNTEILSKYFDELSLTELYEIIKARVQIFVVEQDCPYQDLDDADYRSLHIFSRNDGKITAYLRAFQKDYETVQVGRVLSLEHGKGHGGKLLHDGIKSIKEKMNPKRIYIEAQTHAIGFYEREGFNICSEEFLEDGIPHKSMELTFDGGRSH